MLVVHVHIQVKPEAIQAFIAATRQNCSDSLKEPEVARFDLVQRADDPGRFVLVEAYKSADAPAAHKQTSHYALWRDTVEAMMQSPRSSVRYESVCPEEARWSTPPA